MKINEIRHYINDGVIDNDSLIVECPEQEDGTFRMDYEHDVDPEKAFALMGFREAGYDIPLKGIRWIDLFRYRFPALPYQLRDIHGKRWRVSRSGDFVRLDSDPNDHLPARHRSIQATWSFINFKRDLEDIIRACRPTETRRGDRALGKAYRYNKVLIENGFIPEEFPWIEDPEDIMEMMEFLFG